MDDPTQADTISNANPIWKRISKLFFGGIAVIALLVFVQAAFSWCEYIDLFSIRSVRVEGNQWLSYDEVIDICQFQDSSVIQDIRVKQIQNRLEQCPWIEAAVVSRAFPNRLNIWISERKPVCFLNHRELFLVSDDGILLPVPHRNRAFAFPVITGFALPDSITGGDPIAQHELLDLFRLLREVRSDAPELFRDLSEIHQDPDGEITLFTTHSGTPVFMGKKDISQKFGALAYFQSILNGKRILQEYQYLDLRWDKLIIVKENGHRS